MEFKVGQSCADQVTIILSQEDGLKDSNIIPCDKCHPTNDQTCAGREGTEQSLLSVGIS